MLILEGGADVVALIGFSGGFEAAGYVGISFASITKRSGLERFTVRIHGIGLTEDIQLVSFGFGIAHQL